MHLRHACRADIPTLATTSALAFDQDVLNVYLNPGKERYPEHHRNVWLQLHLPRYYTPNAHIVVVETEGDFDSPPVVVGHAFYERMSPHPPRPTPWQALNLGLIKLSQSYSKLFHLNPAVSSSRTTAFYNALKLDFQDIDEYWHLRELAVHPDHQRKGVGKMLVDWGIEKAGEEGVPLGLESSPVGRGLYEQRGFRFYGVIGGEVREEDEGAGVDGAKEKVAWNGDPLYIWEPTGRKGDWGMHPKGRMEKGDGPEAGQGRTVEAVAGKS